MGEATGEHRPLLSTDPRRISSVPARSYTVTATIRTSVVVVEARVYTVQAEPKTHELQVPARVYEVQA